MVYLGTVFWASVLTGKYGDLLDFVVIIVLIFYILTILGIFILRKKCQMPKDHIELWLSVLPAFYIVVATAICIPCCIPKLVQAVGVS
jgi:APA family basic amino acid/polyamine antiporter